MVKLLQSASNWKIILPAFILFLAFTLFVFPNYQNQLHEISNENIAPLDTRFSYSHGEVSNDFRKLRKEGRELYSVILGRIDMLYPLIYGLLFTLTLAYLIKKNTRVDSKWILIALIPVIGVVLDYLENILILSMLRDYPSIKEDSVVLSEQLTQLKHLFLLSSVGLILILFIVLILRHLMGRKRMKQPVLKKI